MKKLADIGLIGLAVMGENLVLNMENKGFTVPSKKWISSSQVAVLVRISSVLIPLKNFALHSKGLVR